MLKNVTKQRICEIFQSMKSPEIALLFSDLENTVCHTQTKGKFPAL